MPTPGPLELVIILVIALLVLGPGKLPDVGAALGKSIKEFRKASSDVQEAVKLDVDTSPLPNTPAAATPAAPIAAPPVAEPPAQPAPGGRGRHRPIRPTRPRPHPRARRTPPTRRSPPASRAPSTRPWPTLTPCASRVSADVR
jgi:sec-independent protein translocase protein TatA